MDFDEFNFYQFIQHLEINIFSREIHLLISLSLGNRRAMGNRHRR